MKRFPQMRDVADLLDLHIPEGATTEDIYRMLQDKALISDLHHNEKLRFDFQYENETYLFEMNVSTPVENGVFARCVAESLGIQTRPYDVGVLGPITGTLSRVSDKSQSTFFSDEDILKDVSFEELENDYLSVAYEVLNVRYQNHPNCEQIVAHLMDKIVDAFILNIILAIPQLPTWTLQESIDGKVDLMPLEPSTNYLFGGSLQRVPLSQEDRQNILKTTKAKMQNMLDTLVRYKNRDCMNRLVESLWILERDKIKEAFAEMRREHAFAIRNILQIKFFSLCDDYLDFLMSSLGIEKLPITKDVDLQTILSMSNPRRYDKGQAAISIITPNGTHHAIQAQGYLVHHEKQFTDVYGRLYGLLNFESMRLSVIEIHHVCYDSDDRSALVYVPYYITTGEYTDLKEILESLSERGVVIVAKHTGFDPINGCFHKGNEEQFENLDILTHLNSNGFVVDYDWKYEKIDSSKQEPKI